MKNYTLIELLLYKVYMNGKKVCRHRRGEIIRNYTFLDFRSFGDEKTRKMTLFDLPARQAYLGPNCYSPSQLPFS